MNFENIKIIFIDLDGTSLDYKRKLLSDENIETINNLKKSGIKVVVSSGRGLNKKTFNILSQLNSQDLIAWNGAKIIVDNNEIFSKPIEKVHCQIIEKLVKKYNITTIVNSDFRNQTYSNSLVVKLATFFKKGKAKKVSEINLEDDIYKLIFWSLNKNNLKNFLNELNNTIGKELNILCARNYNTFLEVTNIEASKGIAEQKFAQYLNIDPFDCIHIGDTMNDSTTIGKVRYSIAMKNASKEYKSIANFVSPFNYKKGGLAKTLKFIFKK
ncbi:haloacid dehalogenase [Mycoplasmopsis bovigenitalium]|uniref:Cof-type HAD-IIB family hydrolase n=1 Tax=Mycoplasmopsis bovigenitalium TaxID=2112 RepID=UPI00090B320B|nr:Cof-type HAD-IIB family hydrolase [Mycoplasmopsis bovigenitalium]BAW18281.1 haloacid dehalogenase [Mycoplasmopsis bovigenitalium]